MDRPPVTSAGVTVVTEKLAHRRPSPQPCAECTRCPTSTEPGRSQSGTSHQGGGGGRDAGKASCSVQRGSRGRVEASDVRADSGATPAERQGEADRKVCVRPPNAGNYLNLPQ